MKKYFDFTLTGKKFLPVWIVFYLLIILPYALSYKLLISLSEGATPNPFIGFLFLAIIIGAFLISFYILKISIENVVYAENTMRFDGKFGTFLGKVLLGFLLSIITLTIYIAWFMRDITRFIVNHSSMNNARLEFQGNGGRLFLILIVSLFLPMILLTILMGSFLKEINQNFLLSFLYQMVVMIALIPYMYLIYKWMVNLKYKEYTIEWQTEFGPSCSKILVEMILIMITFGIYMPLGYMKLYKYFVERTVAMSPAKIIRFGYDLDATGDFLFIWGQTLLTIITLGIYYPWAYSKIGKRVIAKTYVTAID